jgi:HPt (histidine-containing phosphotransfer) domain-containing protein
VEAGCSAYLAKPVSREVLLREIRAHVKRGESAVPATSPSVRLDQLPAIIRGLVPGYLRSRNEELNRMAGWIAARDFTELRRVGHNLKGSGASFGLPQITEIGRRMEISATNQNLQELEMQLAGLRAAVAAGLTAVSDHSGILE